MSEIVAVDIGGTHARFALAEIEGGQVASLGEPFTVRTADHDGLESAWAAFGRQIGRPLPSDAGIAVAATLGGETISLTNHDWVIHTGRIPAARVRLINDFGAVAYAVARLGPEHFRHVRGPDRPLPEEGAITVVGPGTGLGAAMLLRRGGQAHIVETEGGHIGFAAADAAEDSLLATLRARFERVSAERIASGPGLANLYEALGGDGGRDPAALWQAALAGEDEVAVAAFERFCLVLGSVAGDLALAQGADAVAIAGGLGLRLADRLPRSGFGERFAAKGRYRARMEAMPVKLVTYPQPGLYGAAAAFAEEFGG
ncbi:MAG: glucokinase [Allosphingosinicella sp.]